MYRLLANKDVCTRLLYNGFCMELKCVKCDSRGMCRKLNFCENFRDFHGKSKKTIGALQGTSEMRKNVIANFLTLINK